MAYKRTKEQRHAEYLRTKDKCLARAKKWAEDNPDKRKEIIKKNNAKSTERKLQWYRDNKEKVHLAVKIRRATNPESFRRNSLKHYYKRWFGLSDIPQKEPCVLCGSEYRLHLHHRDGNNGRNGKPMNNDPNNHTWLCNSCHTKVHHRGEIRMVV